ncbi:MAG: hypothetical protein KAX15_03075 [Candidatus Omnitrophica bacterium]|nr:hypothetical protein [Candidatus Omnitrophota bacterium]
MILFKTNNKLKFIKKTICILFLGVITAVFLFKGAVFAQDDDEDEVKSAILEIVRNSVDWSEDSALKLDTRTGTLIVTNTPDNHKVIAQIIRSIDKVPAQVSIETKFVDISSAVLRGIRTEISTISTGAGIAQDRATTDEHLDADVTMSLEQQIIESALLGRLTQMGTIGFTADYVRTKITDFTAVFEALERQGLTKVLSAPKVTALNRQKAVIKILNIRITSGDKDDFESIDKSNHPSYWIQEEPQRVTTSFKETETGITLEVTPNVSQDNKNITLAINADVADIASTIIIGEDAYLNLGKRTVQTNVIVADGETIVMGGMVKNKTQEMVSKVPILGDIPIIGNLFKSKSKVVDQRSLLIFVTVNIITPKGAYYRD